jgi:thioesterase domain-containing protein/acyl carrier protein
VLLQQQGSHSILAAYLVPRNGRCPSLGELRAYLKRRLPEYMVPHRFAQVTTLPRLPSGKIDRCALLQASSPTVEDTVLGPRDPLELRLQLLFERILHRTEVGVDMSFFELGGDSLQALELIVAIERLSGKTLPLETLYQSSSVEELARLLHAHSNKHAAHSLVLLQAGGQRPPLFFVHTTPGDVLGYGNLIYHLDSEQPCYGFQSRGLIDPALSHRRMGEMAAHYVSLLRECQPLGPYYLAGWCYGGLVAVEMARQLNAQGEAVAFLGLLETVAPAPGLQNYRYYVHRMRCFLRMSPGQWRGYFQAKAKYRREVKEANRMRFRRVDQAKYADPIMRGEQNRRLAKLEHVYNTNLAALRHYRPKPFHGTVTLFNAEQIDAGVIPDPVYAWTGLAAHIQVHPVPGDHDTMLTEPNVAVLAARFQECLHRAQKQATASSSALADAIGVHALGERNTIQV